MTDTLIRNARIVDGSGAPWFRGDLRLAGGRIAEIGSELVVAGAEIVEAEGRYLAPGFIDAHAHDDLSYLREPERPEKATQGVTTIVVGNCSFSLYPRVPASTEALRRHFSALLGEVHGHETFDSFADYRAALEGNGIALNLVSLVGHGALRLAVMGHEDRPANADDIAAMQALLTRDVAAGAAGLSLGLVYPPSAYADTAELTALARTTAAAGGLVAAHIRNYEAALITALDEFLAVLEQAGAPGLLSHLQAAGKPNWGRVTEALTRLDRARDAGVDVAFDMYPYPAGSSYILQLLPPTTLAGGLDGLMARLADPEGREALRQSVENGVGETETWQSKARLIGWGNVGIAGTDHPDLKRFEGMRLDKAAEQAGIAPFDFMVRCIELDAGQTAIILFQLSEDDLRAAYQHPLHMVGSDSLPRPGTRPHPRAFGTFPRVIAEMSRARGWFPVEEAVRRMTSVAAQRFGLWDRGLLRPGLAADLVLFDADVADRATFDTPTEIATGVTEVWVAGTPILKGGQVTGERPGRVLTRKSN